jgi:hypothetical protein
MYSNLMASVEADGCVRLSGPCVVTGKEYSVVVPLEGVIAYFKLGANVTSAFPDLPREEREFLISGTSPEGWIQLFGPRYRRARKRPLDGEVRFQRP